MTFMPLILAAIVGVSAGAGSTVWILTRAPSARAPLGMAFVAWLVALPVIAATGHASPGAGLTLALAGHPDGLVWSFMLKAAAAAFAMGGIVITTRSAWSERVFGLLVTGVVALPMYLLNVTALGIGASFGAF